MIRKLYHIKTGRIFGIVLIVLVAQICVIFVVPCKCKYFVSLDSLAQTWNTRERASSLNFFYVAALPRAALYLASGLSKLALWKNFVGGRSVRPVDTVLSPMKLTSGIVYHYDGVAYDYYSRFDATSTGVANHWNTWPLSQAMDSVNSSSPWNSSISSPSTVIALPFVQRIYVLTDEYLTDRHRNLAKALRRQGISLKSISWRLQWDSATCNANSNHEHVYQRLNLNDKPLSELNLLLLTTLWWTVDERPVRSLISISIRKMKSSAEHVLWQWNMSMFGTRWPKQMWH